MISALRCCYFAICCSILFNWVIWWRSMPRSD